MCQLSLDVTLFYAIIFKNGTLVHLLVWAHKCISGSHPPNNKRGGRYGMVC